MKYEELLRLGCCTCPDINDFLSSEVAHVISLLQGELIYTEVPCLNFYNVHKTKDGFLLSEAIFHDQFPDLQVIGSIIPSRLFYPTLINERGTPNMIGACVSRHGYAILADYDPSDSLDLLLPVQFLEVEDDGGIENHLIVETADSYKEHKHHYEMAYDCYNALANGISGYTPPYIRRKLEYNKTAMHSIFYGNGLILASGNNSVVVQKMVEGQCQDRHFDNSMVGIDQYFINMITWYCSDSLIGREMICGKRTKTAFIEWLNKAAKLDGTISHGLHEDVDDKGVIDTLKIKPENGKSILLNAYNPYFYHGVETHMGGSPVFTTLNDFGIWS